MDADPRFCLKRGRGLYISGEGQQRESLHSFAFQTQSPLKVVSTYPQDGGYLWDDNGIEIAFNKNIAGSASQLLQITPQVEGVTKVKGKKLVFYPTQSFEEGKGYQVTVKQG